MREKNGFLQNGKVALGVVEVEGCEINADFGKEPGESAEDVQLAQLGVVKVNVTFGVKGIEIGEAYLPAQEKVDLGFIAQGGRRGCFGVDDVGSGGGWVDLAEQMGELALLGIEDFGVEEHLWFFSFEVDPDAAGGFTQRKGFCFVLLLVFLHRVQRGGDGAAGDGGLVDGDGEEVGVVGDAAGKVFDGKIPEGKRDWLGGVEQQLHTVGRGAGFAVEDASDFAVGRLFGLQEIQRFSDIGGEEIDDGQRSVLGQESGKVEGEVFLRVVGHAMVPLEGAGGFFPLAQGENVVEGDEVLVGDDAQFGMVRGAAMKGKKTGGGEAVNEDGRGALPLAADVDVGIAEI